MKLAMASPLLQQILIITLLQELWIMQPHQLHQPLLFGLVKMELFIIIKELSLNLNQLSKWQEHKLPPHQPSHLLLPGKFAFTMSTEVYWCKESSCLVTGEEDLTYNSLDFPFWLYYSASLIIDSPDCDIMCFINKKIHSKFIF